jgi:pyruvate/2-oxoglutarate dehydrogenase complex dihydrolipoamide acyltransferase (E2) component
MKLRTINMKMPDLSTNEGNDIDVRTWLVELGTQVKRGQPILEIETDKAVQEVEAIADGKLTACHVRAGDSVTVGAVIATIEVEQQ